MLLGIGNSLNGDDGVGCYIAKRFKKQGWLAIDCSTVPENYMGVVKRTKPELLVIVDAACMNLPAGSIRILKKEQACSTFWSTHTTPLKEFISAIEQYAKEIVLIGIQPKQTIMPDELSEEVKDAANRVIKALEQGKLQEIEML
jgi:hydrogenase 3 maturation protease